MATYQGFPIPAAPPLEATAPPAESEPATVYTQAPAAEATEPAPTDEGPQPVYVQAEIPTAPAPAEPEVTYVEEAPATAAIDTQPPTVYSQTVNTTVSEAEPTLSVEPQPIYSQPTVPAPEPVTVAEKEPTYVQVTEPQLAPSQPQPTLQQPEVSGVRWDKPGISVLNGSYNECFLSQNVPLSFL